MASNQSASSTLNVPKTFGPDSLTEVGARSMPATKIHSLPTPPNSISPSLPPHAAKPYGTRSATARMALDHVDSDLDLHDGHDGSEQDALSELGHSTGSSGFDTAGAITPVLLAKHHLPDILLAHGPLAIRHIMGYLTTSVPGFSGIPPAKARRLVVGALEGRGSGGEGGGLKGDVKFEKVGWGRWDAKMKGKARHNGGNRQSPPPSLSSPYSFGMPIMKNSGWDRTRVNAQDSSWAGDSAIFSHDDDIDDMMLENEADKMSLDGTCSSSEAPPDDEVMGDDPDDMTDDEDWAAVGAAALRAGSCSASGGPAQNFLSSRIYTGGSYSAMAKSVPLQSARPTNLELASLGMASDSQEREAIEALLRLGSV